MAMFCCCVIVGSAGGVLLGLALFWGQLFRKKLGDGGGKRV